jgi:hypothetical protein
MSGRTTVMKFRSGDRTLVIKHPDTEERLIASLATAAVYRVAGIPSPHTWAAVAVEDIQGEGRTLIRAGEVVEVAEFITGIPPDLTALENGHLCDQLAARYGIGALLGDWGGFTWINLRQLHDNDTNVDTLVHVDFDEGLRAPSLGVDPFAWMIRRRPEVFGRLTEQDVLAQLYDLIDHGGALRAVLPNEDLRALVDERLARIARSVDERLERVGHLLGDHP